MKKMKKVWDACREAGIDPPDNVEKYFDYNTPNPNGVVVEEKDLAKAGCIKPYKAEMVDGIDLLIQNIPGDVKIIRFYNSYEFKSHR